MRCYYLLALIIVFLFFHSGCESRHSDQLRSTVVFKHGKIRGGREVFAQVLKQFEAENPGIRIKSEELPATTDEQHQFYVINLGAQSSDFDLFAVDTIWVQEFARAGWLLPLSHIFDSDAQSEFFDTPIQVNTFQDQLYAIPWFVDTGLLYYRQDLLTKYNYLPPKTWAELIEISKQIQHHEPGLHGFLWQGREYEGLVCVVLEFLHGNGGLIFAENVPALTSPANREALSLMRALISEHRVTPEFVTTLNEESARQIFGRGDAIFLRNWPYAWSLFQRHDSLVKDKVAITTSPTFDGSIGRGTLGGWQLGINKFSRKPEAAAKLIRYLTSERVQKIIAEHVGYQPSRVALYHDPDLLQQQPQLREFFQIFLHASPRPISPYYLMVSQMLQPEFSAAISGIRSPDQALQIADKGVRLIIGQTKDTEIEKRARQ